MRQVNYNNIFLQIPFKKVCYYKLFILTWLDFFKECSNFVKLFWKYLSESFSKERNDVFGKPNDDISFKKTTQLQNTKKNIFFILFRIYHKCLGPKML